MPRAACSCGTSTGINSSPQGAAGLPLVRTTGPATRACSAATPRSSRRWTLTSGRTWRRRASRRGDVQGLLRRQLLRGRRRGVLQRGSVRERLHPAADGHGLLLRRVGRGGHVAAEQEGRRRWRDRTGPCEGVPAGGGVCGGRVRGWEVRRGTMSSGLQLAWVTILRSISFRHQCLSNCWGRGGGHV